MRPPLMGRSRYNQENSLCELQMTDLFTLLLSVLSGVGDGQPGNPYAGRPTRTGRFTQSGTCCRSRQRPGSVVI